MQSAIGEILVSVVHDRCRTNNDKDDGTTSTSPLQHGMVATGRVQLLWFSSHLTCSPRYDYIVHPRSMYVRENYKFRVFRGASRCLFVPHISACFCGYLANVALILQDSARECHSVWRIQSWIPKTRRGTSRRPTPCG
jgi:hypothetical protein